MKPRDPQHQANIEAKAIRAIRAIDSLIHSRLITDPDFPEITDMASGRAHVLDQLHGDPIDTAPWWVMIGIEHDRAAGVTVYRSGQLPTGFTTSRQSIINRLDAKVSQDARPVSADPFDGLF